MPLIKEPRCKKCRRAGKKLFLKADRCNSSKCAIVKRNFPPGIHGSKGHPRLTEYGIQIAEKQKAKRIYAISEKQFANYFEKASKQSGDTIENLFSLLERRLDNVLYRAKIAGSRTQARQIVSHGHALVNGKKVNIPSYSVKINDSIKIKEKSLSAPLFKDLGKKMTANKDLVNWLSYNKDDNSIRVVDLPKEANMTGEIDFKFIIEFYSR